MNPPLSYYLPEPLEQAGGWLPQLIDGLGLDCERAEAPLAARDTLALQVGATVFSDPVDICSALSQLSPDGGLARPAADSPLAGRWQMACGFLLDRLSPTIAELALQTHPAATQSVMVRLLPLLSVVEIGLRTQLFWLGDEISSVDLMLAAGLRRLESLGVLQGRHPLTGYLRQVANHVAAWRQGPADITVLVLTSPERPADLPLCLEMLCRQSLQPAEVLVWGPDALEEPLAAFAERLPLHHLSDTSVNLTEGYNAAIHAASASYLVVLSAATLLNPLALESYAAGPLDQGLIFGHVAFGIAQLAPEPEAESTVSAWFPERRVAVRDPRVMRYARADLTLSPELSRHPHWFAAGTNFALSRALALELLVDEDLASWQLAVKDLAYRAMRQSEQIDFMLDAWAETLLPEPSAKPAGSDVAAGGLWPVFDPIEPVAPAHMWLSPEARATLLSRLFAGREDTAELVAAADVCADLGREKLSRKQPGANPSVRF